MADFKPNKRKLAERSHLTFEFPRSDGRVTAIHLPMLENCIISEGRRANLASYDLLGRNSTLYSFLGAKSRTFTLTFKITLLNVIDYISKEGLSDKFQMQYNLFFADKETQKKAFFALVAGGLEAETAKSLVHDKGFNGGQINGMDHAAIHRKYYHELANIAAQNNTFFDSLVNVALTGLGLDTSQIPNTERYRALNKSINLIVFWINLVRSSCINNSKNTTEGPPVVRLNHGILYNNIPCIVENYTMSILEDYGYDIQTMLPKMVEISLNLNEVRTSNYGDFKATELIDGDNNTGWESVITGNNMDPYNGDIH